MATTQARPRAIRLKPLDGAVVERAGGEVATIGRGPDQDVRLPKDDFHSRRAASLIAHSGHILVWNESRHRPFTLRRSNGVRALVHPGHGAVVLYPEHRVELWFAGRHDVAFTVEVTVYWLCVVPPSEDACGDRPTRGADIDLPPNRLRALRALCSPLLFDPPRAYPATNAEIAQECGITAASARNAIADVRDAFVAAGVPLRTCALPDGDAATGADLRLSLARWAIWLGHAGPDLQRGERG